MTNKLVLDDPFVDLPIQKQVNISGRQIDVPTKYRGHVAMAVFPISTKKAIEQIGTDKLKPVEIGIGKSLVALTIFDNYSTPVGPYKEIVISIPVLYKSKFSIPILPLLFRNKLKNFGYYVITIASNTDISREEGSIFGYPHYEKNIEVLFNEGEEFIEADILENNQNILKLKIKNTKKEIIEKINYNTYFKQDNDIYRVIMNTAGIIGRSEEIKCGELFLDNHEITNLLSGLEIDNNALEISYYREIIEVLNLPEKIGNV